jgi:metal-responsive CopG/Arc/MetJ family transcriptional regulator
MVTTKVMVSFPDEFLTNVDRVAQEEHRSRSELVREALRLYMGLRQAQKLPGSNPLVREAVMVQDRLSRAAPGTGEDSTADLRRWREARG